LKKTTLEEIRIKLKLPDNISQYFYFITHKARTEIAREDEARFYATDLYF
jgi:hypothetical protein